VDEIFKLNFWEGFIFFLYIFFFFLGSFISNIIVEMVTRIKDKLIYIIPIIIESIILFSIAIFGQFLILKNPNLLAFSLLFAMGMQNSLVTTISNATVRTTHLTGLFTDLGIELSQLFFYTKNEQKVKLYSSIKLRLTIISFFFFGGLLGGIFYTTLKLYILAIAGIILIIGIISDYLKLKLLMHQREQQELHQIHK
jgi:uncharacterized membrane protein YoaK (UPF0700 family)